MNYICKSLIYILLCVFNIKYLNCSIHCRFNRMHNYRVRWIYLIYPNITSISIRNLFNIFYCLLHFKRIIFNFHRIFITMFFCLCKGSIKYLICITNIIFKLVLNYLSLFNFVRFNTFHCSISIFNN